MYNDHQFLSVSNVLQVNPAQLSVLNYANHFTMWHYKTRHETILCPGYFNAVADILRENDMIIATTDLAETPCTTIYIVLARTADHIVVSPLDMGCDRDQGEDCGRYFPLKKAERVPDQAYH